MMRHGVEREGRRARTRGIAVAAQISVQDLVAMRPCHKSRVEMLQKGNVPALSTPQRAGAADRSAAPAHYSSPSESESANMSTARIRFLGATVAADIFNPPTDLTSALASPDAEAPRAARIFSHSSSSSGTP